MSTATKRICLNKRDEKILNHVHRYRVTTAEVLHRLFWEPEASLNAVSQVASVRLKGYLHSATLVGSRKMYLLTPALAREFGEDEDFAKPPRGPSLARHIAMLEYCCFDEEPREHITSQEFRDGFPSYSVRGVARNSYFHTLATPRGLGWLEVDCRGKPRLRAQKCLTHYQERYQNDKLRALADEGRFRMVLVTTSSRKEEQLKRIFERLDPFPLEIVVNPTVREIVLRDSPHP